MNAAFAMTNLDVISRGHLASFVILLPKQLKYSTLSSNFWLPQPLLIMVALRFSLLQFSPYSSSNSRIIQCRFRHVGYDATEQKFVQGFGAKAWRIRHYTRNLRADGGILIVTVKACVAFLRPKLYSCHSMFSHCPAVIKAHQCARCYVT